MPAYSFQPRFALPIIRGDKGGTIRATRKRSFGSMKAVKRWHETGGHAFPGEPLALYTGMRTANCRLITNKVCEATEPIELNFETGDVAFGPSESNRLHISGALLDVFARFDGFESWAELTAFWRETHGPVGDVFKGWHIRWLPLPAEIPT